MDLISESRPLLDAEHGQPRENKMADIHISKARSAIRSVLCHLHTIFLFTMSDFKTVFIPQSVFALCAAYSPLTTPPSSTDGHDQSRTRVLPHRILLMHLWLYATLLLEDIANQRLPPSILEDAVNKPWRPLPAGRITTKQSDLLLRIGVPLCLIFSAFVGNLEPTAIFICLVWLYNDLDASSAGPIQRNALNATGLACFGWGALTVLVPDTMTALGQGGGAEGGRLLDTFTHAFHRIIFGGGAGGDDGSGVLLSWTLLIAAVVATTIHAQDFPDIEGDKERGRKTMPLRYGQGVSRWSLAVFCVVWSVVCLRFWTIELGACWIPATGVGGLMAVLTLLRRGLYVDEIVWKLWCLWMVVLFTLPLYAGQSVKA